MATFVLDGKASATLPRRPVAVSMSTSGSSRSSSARLSVRSVGAPPRVVQQSSDLLILPRVDAQITVIAVPDAGRERFDQGTVLHVTFGPDSSADSAADVVQLTPRDVSGLSFIELATVEPFAEDSILVKTRLALPDASLPVLAARARVACRGVLRVDQVDDSATVDVRCVVDTSASMAAAFASGAVAACGDIIAGVGAVVGSAPQVDLALAGPAAEAGLAVDGAGLGDALVSGPASGYGLAADPSAPYPPRPVGNRTLTIVVTDGPGVVDPGDDSVVALVISASTAAARRRGFVGAIVPPPPAGTDARAFLAERPDVVTRIVQDLVVSAGIGGGAR